MLQKNHFSLFNIPISINVEIGILNTKYQDIVKISNNVDEKFNITNAYSVLKNEISRGDYILNLFKIQYSSIEISKDFFEYIVEGEEVALKNTAKEIYEKIKSIEVSDDNINFFAKYFLMYKYITNLL